MINNPKVSYTNDSRITLIILTLVYIIAVMWGFIVYLVPWWGYFGIEYTELSIEIKLMVAVFCLLPVFWMPIKIIRPSMFAYWILYFLTYIPMIVGSGLESKFETSERIYISIAYLVGFKLLGASYQFKLVDFGNKNIQAKYFWLFYYLVTFSMFLYVLFLFRDNLTFADLFSSDAVYDTRFSGQEIENQSVIAGHFIMWLSNALFPFLIAVGLVNKDRVKLIIGIVGLVLLYMTMANKQFLFVILFMILIYRLFRMKSQRVITYFLLGLLIPTILLVYSQTLKDFSLVLFSISGIFLLRTVYTSTFMSVYYNIFFENHPYLYFSHISGINKFVDYPYKNQIGVEVGSYFTKFDNYNANANFFITDGLSSIGLLGIPLMGLLCAIVFFLFDSSANKKNRLLSILLIASSAVALMNVSLFTTLISGGLLFFILLINNSGNIINKAQE
ncbi:hypothetical protein [Flavobacterium sp. ZE23DGlu08]|uniref:hypothetical protein n=1 Tax=Flavobacterium sp. ZE23DGlu08 TaxID=3059026 RepID=UPI00265D7544|nr:hypothetical protein [Flavobacterium sp. ZE23DGlu08]WKL45050.1 hypothetical protein Q1W72_05415 [Flavobacterium sp. ZE23DGlu08]